jgi:hypothetical protein
MLENSAAVVAAKSPGSAPKDVRKRRQVARTPPMIRNFYLDSR